MQSHSSILISTAYLPPIEYIALILKYKNVIIEKEESYLKQTYRNRCLILSANGTLNLSIPITKPSGNNSITKKIRLINSSSWFINHWRAINSAYSSSPFFLYYKDDLERFFVGDFDNLLEFNTELLKEILSIIGISYKIKYSNSFNIPNLLPNDFRYSISPKVASYNYKFTSYTQVFSNKFKFTPNLSIIDLLFNLGPETADYLMMMNNQKQIHIS